jgi:hypothetical protein
MSASKTLSCNSSHNMLRKPNLLHNSGRSLKELQDMHPVGKGPVV